jgi:CubicO group peptidase (beta-lactamase class C family)
MKAILAGVIGIALAATALVVEAQSSAREFLIERAKALELNSPYVPPPGDPMEHHASGYAKIMCSAVFVSGLDAAFAAESVGYFTAPVALRAQFGMPRIDHARRAVRVTLPNGVVRTALQRGSQGCVTLPTGKSEVLFKPSVVKPALPDAKTTPWPMGDVLPTDGLPQEIDKTKLQQAVDTAFDPAGMTAAFVVTYKGGIIAERYGEGITHTTPLESWSMGKSVVATLIGRLIQQGTYQLTQPAPIPEWQAPGDPRAKIRIADILQMSSGLRMVAPQDPDYQPAGPYPDHLYLYTGSVDTAQYAATRPLQWPPGTVGRYRNGDPVLAAYLVRLAVEKRKEDYHAFPQRALFDKIGVRHFTFDTDPYGNFLVQGYEQAPARDWARLANLYLQDGVWNGERLLPEGYVKFVSTPAPAWVADKRPVYGGFFWVNGNGAIALPRETYYMAGSGTQMVFMVPSHQLAIVRLGHYKGGTAGYAALEKAIALLMGAVPPVERRGK